MEKIPDTSVYKKFIQLNRNVALQIQRILEAHNVPFYPTLVEDLPNFSSEAHKYMQSRVERDVPRTKEAAALIENSNSEDDFLNNKNLLVEIGGFLGVKEKDIVDISYAEPDVKNVRVEKLPEGVLLTTSTPQPSDLDYRLLESSDSIIHWHTHPKPSVPTEGDFNAMLRYHKFFNNYFGDEKKIYYVVYIPELEKGFWYEIKDSA